MEPINIKERRQSILKFLGFFILAILPICAVIYLFSKVDSTENRVLRAQLDNQTVSVDDSEDIRQLEVAFQRRMDGFMSFVQGATTGLDLSDDLNDWEGDSLKTTLQALNKIMPTSDPRKEYVGMMLEMRKLVREVDVKLYRNLLLEHDRVMKDLDECNGRLREVVGI